MKEELNKRQKNYAIMRSVLDYGMGIIVVSIGIFFLFSKQIVGREYLDDVWMKYIVGTLFILYGGFRVYRGYKKNYFKED